MKFKTSILQTGNNTGIEVPADVVQALGGGKKPAISVTIGSYGYRSSIAVMGGKFLIPLSAERRAESGIRGGDTVEVELALDTAAGSCGAGGPRRGAGRRCRCQGVLRNAVLQQ